MMLNAHFSWILLLVITYSVFFIKEIDGRDVIFVEQKKALANAVEHCIMEGGELGSNMSDITTAVSGHQNFTVWIGGLEVISPWMENMGCFPADSLPARTPRYKFNIQNNRPGMCFVLCNTNINTTAIMSISIEGNKCFCYESAINIPVRDNHSGSCLHCGNGTRSFVYCGGNGHANVYNKIDLKSINATACNMSSHCRFNQTGNQFLIPKGCINDNCNNSRSTTLVFREKVFMPNTAPSNVDDHHVRRCYALRINGTRNPYNEVNCSTAKHAFVCIVDSTPTLIPSSTVDIRTYGLTSSFSDFSRPTVSSTSYKDLSIMSMTESPHLYSTSRTLHHSTPNTDYGVVTLKSSSSVHSTGETLDHSTVKTASEVLEPTKQMEVLSTISTVTLTNTSENATNNRIRSTDTSHEGLSTGAVVGITIGCVIFIGASVTVVIFVVKKKPRAIASLDKD